MSVYQDEWGFIVDRSGQSGNAILFTAEYLAAGGVAYPALDLCEVMPGLFVQHPVHFRADQQSPDNLTGLGFISWANDPKIAQRILTHLRTHHYLYVTELGVDGRAFFGRFPALIAHLQWAAGERPNWFLRLCWCISVAFKLDSTKHDSFTLSWLLTLVAGDKGPLERWAVRRFWRKFPWPSMADCLAEYFEDDQHPTVVLLRERGDKK